MWTATRHLLAESADAASIALSTHPRFTRWPREPKASRQTNRRHGISSTSTQTTREPSGRPNSWCSRRIDPDSPRSRFVQEWFKGRAIPNRLRRRSPRLIRAQFVAIVPPGGIPIIDVELLALAHRRALVCGNGGERYAVVGPYLSYGDLAGLVASLTGRPRWLIPLPDRLNRLIVAAADWSGPLARRWWPDVSRRARRRGIPQVLRSRRSSQRLLRPGASRLRSIRSQGVSNAVCAYAILDMSGVYPRSAIRPGEQAGLPHRRR